MSLFDVLRFNAAFFVSACSSMQSIRAEFQILQGAYDQAVIDKVIGWMEQLIAECHAHEFQLSESYIGDVVIHLRSLRGRGQDFSINRFVHYVDGVEERICEDLHFSWFLHMQKKKVGYYEGPREMFDQQLIEKLPNATFDIEEAGKCLAFDRGTACVFHLMRVMELAVQEFGIRLGVRLASEKNWQNIIDEINKAVRALPYATREEKNIQSKYATCSGHLFNVKVAWRNEVMHPRAKYTEEEAQDIFNNVKTFAKYLVKEILA